MAEWETGWSGLERVVALLFSLAGLADLAARAPAHRRRLDAPALAAPDTS